MLTAVYGRAGTGKTQKLLDFAREYADAVCADGKNDASGMNGAEGALFLVPETASHMTERRLAAALGDRASACCEVVTFRRLAHKIFCAAGGLALHAPDDGARILLMYGAFERLRRAAKIYTRMPRSCTTLESFLAFYDECAAGCAGPERLAELAGSCSGELRDKLSDLAALFAFYEENVRAALADPRDALERAAALAVKCGFFTGKTVFFDGFEGFTPRERALIDVIFAQCRDVFAAFSGSSLAPDEDSVFAHPMRTAAWMLRAAESSGHAARLVYLDGAPARPGDVAVLEASLEDYGAPSYEGECPAVRLYAARNVPSECAAAAAELLRLVREKRLRFRDCAVVSPAPGSYAQTLTATLERCGVPYFLSEKTDLLATPVCALAVTALDAAAGGMETEDVLAWLKTGLTPLSHDEIDRIENYCLVRKIRSFSSASPWTGHPDGTARPLDEEAAVRLAALNELRERVREPLVRLREGIGGTTPAIEKARALYDFLEEVRLPQTCEERAAGCERAADRAGADLYRQLWDVLCRALDSFAGAVGERAVDARTFAALFRLTLSQYSVGVIPSSLDRVHIGPLESVQSRAFRAVFILGMTDAAYPGTGEGGGLLSDAERERLDTMGLELSATPDTREQAQRFALYAAVSAPDVRLWISYPANDEGETRESPAFARIRTLLPGAPFETERGETDAGLAAALPAAETALAGQTAQARAAREWMERHEPYASRLRRLEEGAALPRGPVASRALRQALYGKRPRLSATGVDLFFSCRYRYFAGSGLRLDERRPADFDGLESGSFLHFVLEHTARDVHDNYLSWRDAPKAAVQARGRYWSEVYAEEKLGGLSRQTARFRFLFSRVRDSLDVLLADLCDEFSVCLFEPYDFELTFSSHDVLGSVEIPLGNGVTATLSGKVDRVDGMYRDGKLYVRVVDYKSAVKAFSYADIDAGLGLQLVLYLFVLEERAARYRELHPELPPGTPLVPAGVLYAPVGSPILSLPAYPEDEEELRAAVAKKNSRTGLLADDAELLHAMEPDARGVRIPVKFTKTGAPRAGSPVASPEQFRSLERHVRRMLREMGRGLACGDNDASPIVPKNGYPACALCPYHAVCRFDESLEQPRRPGALSRDAFFQKIGGETD
ncbi:MAG: PD-(D/E)XK nuclease family protein [Eubacteriales bacterium]|nr:PD-(D/E)XK nuclease family protein [Eubacteriales bacterium]